MTNHRTKTINDRAIMAPDASASFNDRHFTTHHLKIMAQDHYFFTNGVLSSGKHLSKKTDLIAARAPDLAIKLN